MCPTKKSMEFCLSYTKDLATDYGVTIDSITGKTGGNKQNEEL